MRNAPSQFEFFSLRNGVMPASGHVFMWGPLSVEYDDDGVVRDAEGYRARSSSAPTTLSWSIIVSW